MGRTRGTFETSGNFEVKKKGAWDARTRVKAYADLLGFTSADYIENGHVVDVYDADASKRGSYMCIGENALSVANSWLKIGGNTEWYQLLVATEAGQAIYNIDFDLSNVSQNKIVVTLSSSNGVSDVLVPGVAFEKNGNSITLKGDVPNAVQPGYLLTVRFNDLEFISKIPQPATQDAYALQTEEGNDFENEDGTTTQYEY